jgi:hypothetical protein
MGPKRSKGLYIMGRPLHPCYRIFNQVCLRCRPHRLNRGFALAGTLEHVRYVGPAVRVKSKDLGVSSAPPSAYSTDCNIPRQDDLVNVSNTKFSDGG